MNESNNIDNRKRYKKNLILQLIRSSTHPSRSSLKKKSGLSMESVLQYINELIDENLIKHAGLRSSSVGRKATILKINPSGAYFIGIKFNVVQLIGVVMDFSGDIIRQRVIAFPPDVHSQTVIDVLLSCIQDLIDSMGTEKCKIKGIGIGVPGYVDSKNGIATLYVHISDWQAVPLSKIVANRFGLPTYLEQSVKVTALALKQEAENHNIQDLLYVLVGRGIGMVIIANNKIYNGHNNGAGELGHMFVTDNGLVCECGKQGCLETEASHKAILQKVYNGLQCGKFPVLRLLLTDSRMPTMDDYIQSIQLNDPDSIQLMQQVYLYLGRAMTNVVTLLSPQKIIFSGEITRTPGFIEAIRAELERNCSANTINSLELQSICIDDKINARDAAILAYIKQFGTNDSTNNSYSAAAEEGEEEEV